MPSTVLDAGRVMERGRGRLWLAGGRREEELRDGSSRDDRGELEVGRERVGAGNCFVSMFALDGPGITVTWSLLVVT